MSDVIDEALNFLQTELSKHSDAISIEQFEYLLAQDKHNLLILKALEYAKDANVNYNDRSSMQLLLESVGNKVDILQEQINKASEIYQNLEQQKAILEDLQMIHFGLIGMVLVTYTNSASEAMALLEQFG